MIPPANISDYLDLYQNCVHLFEVSRAHRELTVTATSRVQTSDVPVGPPPDASTTNPKETTKAEPAKPPTN